MKRHLGIVLLSVGIAACSHHDKATQTARENDQRTADENNQTYASDNNRALPAEDREGAAVAPQRRERGEMASADNTLPDNARNRNETAGSEVTPTDQSEDEDDIRVVQSVRRALMDDDTLSFSGKNVKIITNGGHVILRGGVDTARERTVIEDLAKRQAGVTSVDNQIEITKQ